MNIVKRIKKLWKLTKKDEKSLEEFMKLSDKELMDLPDEETSAFYIGGGTEEEYKDFENEQKGLKGIFGLK